MAENNDKKPGNYLSFDGGHSGLPALCIGEQAFYRLQYDIDSEDEIRPCDHCDLFMGSGPGAVDSILLGRLGLNSSEAIEAYQKLEPALSVGPAKDDEERKRNSDAFEAAFREVLSDAGFEADAPMVTTDTTKARTVVCTTSTTNLSALYPIRSYRVREGPALSCTILQAACASIASPDKFLPVTIGKGHRKVTLIDAMAGYPNPTRELLKEAQHIFGEDAKVATVISIGSGKKKASNFSAGDDQNALVEAVKDTVINAEITHEELETRLNEAHLYFRFNVPHDLGIGVDSSDIYAHTATYLVEADTNKRLNEAIKSIQNRSGGMTLKELNVVTPVKITLRPRPSVVPTFIGRKDILEAMQQTHFGDRPSGSNMPAISVLTGLGGSGKTQIALKFALDFEERYPDAPVYFINADSEDNLKTDYESIIRSQGGSHHSDSHEDALKWIATQQSEWCIILDNADDPEVDIFSHIPKGFHGNVIVTTRNWTHRALSPNTSHVIEGLIVPDAITLLLQISEYEVTADNQFLAQQIVHEVENLPLAIAHAGGYIYVHRCLDTYLAMYHKSKAKLLASRPRSLPQDYQLSVATTIQMSLDRLPQAALDTMVVFSRLDVTSIAQSIVTKAAERQFKNIVTDLIIQPLHTETIQYINTLMSIFCPGGGWDEFEYNGIVEKCLQYSLLRCYAQGTHKFHSMHRLVQTYLQVHFNSVQEHHPNQLVACLLGSAITIGKDYEYLAFNRLLAPHLQLVEVTDVVEAHDHHKFGMVLQEQGNVSLAVTHLEWCLALQMSCLDDRNPLLIFSMANLATSYHDLGQYQQAVELKEQVMERQRELLGPDHPHSVRAMANLACSYHDLGRYQEAVELEEQILEKQRESLGPDHPDSLWAMGNLASSYRDLGQSQQAVELEEQVLEKQRELRGPDHPHSVRAMANLACSYRELGQYQQAVELEEQVLEKRREFLGPDHPDSVRAMANLACGYRDLKQYQQAVELEEQVLEKRRELLGPDHPDSVRAMANLASSYSDLGQDQQAVELEEQVLDKRRELLGPDHPDSVQAMANLASSYNGLGQYQQAVELREQVLKKQRELLGPDHPHTVQAMGNLAGSYSSLGRHQQAFELEEQVLEKQRELLGPDHPHTLLSMSNLACYYHSLGQYQQALGLQELVLMMQQQLLGEEHPRTLTAMQNLAVTLHGLGMKEQLLEVLLMAVPIHDRINGVNDHSTMVLREWLNDLIDNLA